MFNTLRKAHIAQLFYSIKLQLHLSCISVAIQTQRKWSIYMKGLYVSYMMTTILHMNVF